MSTATEKSDVEVKQCEKPKNNSYVEKGKNNEKDANNDKANNDKPQLNDLKGEEHKNNEPKCELKGIKRSAEVSTNNFDYD